MSECGDDFPDEVPEAEAEGEEPNEVSDELPDEVPEAEAEGEELNEVSDELPDNEAPGDEPYDPFKEYEPNEKSDDEPYDPFKEYEPDEKSDDESYDPFKEYEPDEKPDDESYDPFKEYDPDEEPDKTSEEISNPSKSGIITVAVSKQPEQQPDQEPENEPEQDLEETPEEIEEFELITAEGEPEKPNESPEVMKIRADLEEMGLADNTEPFYRHDESPELNSDHDLEQETEQNHEYKSELELEKEFDNLLEQEEKEVSINDQELKFEDELHQDGKIKEEIESQETQEELKESLQESNLEKPQESKEKIQATEKDNYEILKEHYHQETRRRAIYAQKETKGFIEWKERKEEKEYKEYEEKQELDKKSKEKIQATEKDNYEVLKEQYHCETERRAIYAQKETKGFIEWKERKEEKEYKEHEEKQELDKESKKEIQALKEESVEYLINSIKETASNEEISEKTREELIELLKKYDKIYGLYKKLQNREIVKQEFEQEIDKIEKEFGEKLGIVMLLFKNFEVFHKYYNEMVRRAGKRVAMLQISHKTTRFLLNISRRLEQYKKEGISQDSLEKNSVSQEWAILLKNHIEESTDQEISKEIKEELQYLIHQFTNNHKLLIKQLKEHNPRFDDFFKELKSSLAIYKEYKSRNYEKSLIPEGKRVAKKIAHQLVEIKKKFILQQIFNENNPEFQNLKEILKENLYKSIELNMNEKSKIIKILQKRNLTEEDNSELRLLLNKLSRKELFSLLGRDFENYSVNQDLQSEIDNKKEEIKKIQEKIHSFVNNEMSNKKSQVEYDTGDLISKITEKKEILEEFINFNQNLDMTKFSFPEEKILIDKEILNRFYRECTEKDPNLAEIFLDIVRPLSKGNSISLKEFKKLENLLSKVVPHKKIIGKKNQVCIEANKSNEIAELLGLIWGRGRIDIKHPRYDLLIYLKGIHKDRTFITYLKNILMKALKVNENKVQINPNKEFLRLSSKVIIYELLKLGIFPKKSKYYHTIPLWIFEDTSFVSSFLRGILGINSMFSLRIIHDSSIPRYNLQFLVNKNSNKYLKAVQFLFHLFDLESNIYNNSLVIDKKSDLTRIINEFLPPSIWNLMKISLENSLEDKNPELSDLLNYHEKVLISYHRDFAYNLISQFEQLGSFELVSEHIGKNGILGIDRIINYVKKFFKEPDLVDVYGDNAYIHWYSNNKLIHIGTDLQSSKIPFKILKIIICNIYEALRMNNFLVNNEFLINHLVDFFTTSELFKFQSTKIPNILRFGRICYLLKKNPSRKLLIEFFDNIIKFVRKIQFINESGYTTSYTKLAEEFNLIFYHHQQIKEIIDDLNNVFNIKLKIRRQNKYGKYKWTLNLIFKWNYKNFYKINNNSLKRNLGEILNIVENGNYDDEIFELRNPSCSQFYIKGDSSHHLMDNEINHFNDQMIDKKIILNNQFSELGRKLINYVNLASIHYRDNKKAFSEKGNRVIHDYLQSYIRERDNNIIVTELLIWLPINNPSINADYIYGHIDFLFYFNDTLYVCDYKPLDKNFFRSLPQVCLYGLVLEKMLNISNLKIKCITFNQEQSWEFSPSILNTHVKEIIKKIQKINPRVKMEWNQYIKF